MQNSLNMFSGMVPNGGFKYPMLFNPPRVAWARPLSLITGIIGGDSSYFARFLFDKEYEVHGIKRRASLFNTDRIVYFYQYPPPENRKIVLHYGDLIDVTNLIRILQLVQPDELNNLADQSSVQVF